MGVWIETVIEWEMPESFTVTPCVGVWIETSNAGIMSLIVRVTPCVGVWIETSTESESDPSPLSHPAWVCGLKLFALRQ